MAPDGTQLLATGTTAPIDSYDSDIATVSFGVATGAIRWSARWNGPENGEFDQGYGIAVDPAGTTAYVAGETRDGGTYAFVTLAYRI